MKAGPTTRSISACEIARNVKFFETWSALHGLDQVEFSDIPRPLKSDVDFVFDLNGKLPASWVDKASKQHSRLSKLAPSLLKFLIKANGNMPALFSDDVTEEMDANLMPELTAVYLAWSQLYRMKRADERWSEADFAANVYNVLRSPAIRQSSHRTQCSIHLPRHFEQFESKHSIAARRTLKARTVVPDGAIFIRSTDVKKLASAKSSPYKVINAHASTKNACTADSENAFRYQATPCVQPQQSPCFEFASAFWEDKKPGFEVLENAYRQNRMACSSALRHLDALDISAPVFGLIWADGKVKAHVDWCLHDGGIPYVYSAAYPGPPDSAGSRRTSYASLPEVETEFYEWDLYKPADIISVFLLIRNLDIWTASTFRERVERSVQAVADGVANGTRPYVPWKDSMLHHRVLRSSSMANSENILPISAVTDSTASTTPASSRPRRKAAGTKAKGPGVSRV